MHDCAASKYSAVDVLQASAQSRAQEQRARAGDVRTERGDPQTDRRQGPRSGMICDLELALQMSR